MSVRYAIEMNNEAHGDRTKVYSGGCFGSLANLGDLVRWGTNSLYRSEDVTSLIYISDNSYNQFPFSARDEYFDALLEHTIVGEYFTELTDEELDTLQAVSESGNLNSSFNRSDARAFRCTDVDTLTADEIMWMMFVLRIPAVGRSLSLELWEVDTDACDVKTRLLELMLCNAYSTFGGNCSEYSTITRLGLDGAGLIRAIRTIFIDKEFGITIKGRQRGFKENGNSGGYARDGSTSICTLMHAGGIHRATRLNQLQFHSGNTLGTVRERRAIMTEHFAEAYKSRKVKKGFITAANGLSVPSLRPVFEKFGYDTPVKQARALASIHNVSRNK